jgi:hypothetical protein
VHSRLESPRQLDHEALLAPAKQLDNGRAHLAVPTIPVPRAGLKRPLDCRGMCDWSRRARRASRVAACDQESGRGEDHQECNEQDCDDAHVRTAPSASAVICGRRLGLRVCLPAIRVYVPRHGPPVTWVTAATPGRTGGLPRGRGCPPRAGARCHDNLEADPPLRSAGSADPRSNSAHRTRSPNITGRPPLGAPERHICARVALRTDRRLWRVQRPFAARGYVRLIREIRESPVWASATGRSISTHSVGLG